MYIRTRESFKRLTARLAAQLGVSAAEAGPAMVKIAAGEAFGPNHDFYVVEIAGELREVNRAELLGIEKKAVQGDSP